MTPNRIAFLVAFLALALAAALLLRPTPAHAADFYQWRDRWGTLCFTDDVKAIPRAYRPGSGPGEARLRSFDELPPIMPVAAARYPYRWRTTIFTEKAFFTPTVNMAPVEIHRSREQVGDYNRTFYTVTEGGRVLTHTTEQPRVVISR